MNVTELHLNPRDYGRANYIKTEIVSLLRYVRVNAPNKKPLALAFMDEARALMYSDLGEDLPATLPAGDAAVSDNDTAPVKRSDGTTVGAAGTINVAAGAVTDVTLPATTAVHVGGAQTGITVTGTYTANVSFTVSAGKITGITLS